MIFQTFAGLTPRACTHRKELDFVKRLLSTAKTVEEVVAAARCAARVANNARTAAAKQLGPGQVAVRLCSTGCCRIF